MWQIYARDIEKENRDSIISKIFFRIKKISNKRTRKRKKKRKENVKFTKKYLITLNTSLHRYRWNDTNLAEGKSYTSGRYIDARVCMRTRVYLKSWRTLLPSCSIHERNTHTWHTYIVRTLTYTHTHRGGRSEHEATTNAPGSVVCG